MTAQEFLKERDSRQGTAWTEDNAQICKALDDFSKQHNAELIEVLKSLLPLAEQEAASLADVDEPELADEAWDIIDKAAKLLE